MDNLLHNINMEVQRGDTEKVKELVKAAINQEIPPLEILENSLRPALDEVGRKFEKLEVYLPEMMLAADAMIAGIDLLRPHLTSEQGAVSDSLILLGTVEGDVHDIGKNIVGIMLEGAGFKVVDLGHDVPVPTFVDRVAELKPDILGMSALMTTTMLHMPRIINALEERGIRERVKVVVGGAPVLPEWANEIGADGYGENATEAVDLIKGLVE